MHGTVSVHPSASTHGDPGLTRATLARCPERSVPLALTWFDPAPSTTALWNDALRHPCRSLKGPFLQDPPPWPALASGMRQVLAEKWAWQESTARAWLESNSGLASRSPTAD